MKPIIEIEDLTADEWILFYKILLENNAKVFLENQKAEEDEIEEREIFFVDVTFEDFIATYLSKQLVGNGTGEVTLEVPNEQLFDDLCISLETKKYNLSTPDVSIENILLFKKIEGIFNDKTIGCRFYFTHETREVLLNVYSLMIILYSLDYRRKNDD